MSLPTDRLAQLSIARPMSNTRRSEAQQERRRREAEQKRREQERRTRASTFLPPPSQQDRFESATTLKYNAHGLSDTIKAIAARGLMANNLYAGKVMVHPLSTEGPYVVIQIIERLRLCIYTLPKDDRKVECSCVEFATTTPKTCAHIYWLYDQINALQKIDPSVERSLNVQDVEASLSQVSIQHNLVDGLPEESGPLWTEPDDDVDVEIEDMLAVLDPKRLPGEYDEEFYNNLPTSETHQFYDLVVPGNIFNTIFALARHDRVFRERLYQAIPQHASNKDLFHKLSKRRHVCLEQLSKYEKEGPELRTNEVARCAWHLREIITKLSDHRQRIYESPNLAFDRACARTTVKILRAACSWNRDIYTNATWFQSNPPPTAPTDCNLYLNLMQQSNNANPLITFLCTDLPAEASSTYQTELTDLVTKLKDFHAAPSILQPLLALTQTLRSTPTTSTGPLTVLDNLQSRPARTGSSSSESSCASASASNTTATARHQAGHSGAMRRQASLLEASGAQRRRLG